MKIKLNDLKNVADDVNRELRFLKALKEELQTKLSYRCVGNTNSNGFNLFIGTNS